MKIILVVFGVVDEGTGTDGLSIVLFLGACEEVNNLRGGNDVNVGMGLNRGGQTLRKRIPPNCRDIHE